MRSDESPNAVATLPTGRGRSYHAAGMTRRRVLLWVVVALALASGAVAQEKRKKITLDDLVIEGNIQKPEAFFILPRTNLNFADLEGREDLKSRIIKSVEKEPF